MRSRSRSKSPSRKASKSSHRRSRSRSHSKRSKKTKSRRYRSPDRKASKYRGRSSSESSPHRHKSSKHKRHRHRRSSSSASSTSGRSSNSNSKSSSSSSRQNSRKPSSSYMDKIRALRTPTPPKITFSSNLDFLDNRVLSDAINEINADRFVAKAFSSTATDEMTNKKVEKTAEVKKVAIVDELREVEDDPLFHKNLFADEDDRMERWVRKVYNYRQKLLAPAD